jgi:methionyl-tRNA formyltransferase
VRIIFMGTGEIGLPSLRWLLDESGHDIVGVFTQPDRAVGRSGKLQAPQVKVIAEAVGVPVFQPEKLRGDEQALAAIVELEPELIVVVAYGQILPKAVLEAPSIACINLHASLLPRHRGAAPIQSAIRDGDAESGMTVMHISARLDAGDMIFAESTPIGADDTGGILHDRLAELGPPALARALPLLESGEAPREVQDESLATHCGKLTRENGCIDWSRPAVEIERLIRAYDPWPGTHTFYVAVDGNAGPMLKLFPPVAVVPVAAGEMGMGEVRLEPDASAFLIGTGEGALKIAAGAVQLEGRKRVKVAEFLAGRGVADGAQLGDGQQ